MWLVVGVATWIGFAIMFIFGVLASLAVGAMLCDLWRTRNLRDESKRNRAKDLELYIRE
jgi:hypothetical protein